MAYENMTSGNNEYFTRLQAEARRGQLQAETVSADSRATMVEQVVNPALQGKLARILFPNRRYRSSLYAKLEPKYYDSLDSPAVKAKIARRKRQV